MGAALIVGAAIVVLYRLVHTSALTEWRGPAVAAGAGAGITLFAALGLRSANSFQLQSVSHPACVCRPASRPTQCPPLHQFLSTHLCCPCCWQCLSFSFLALCVEGAGVVALGQVNTLEANTIITGVGVSVGASGVSVHLALDARTPTCRVLSLDRPPPCVPVCLCACVPVCS